MALDFDLSIIPDDAVIEKAELAIFLNYFSIEYEEPVACSLFACSKQWNEDEVTWKNASASVLWEQKDPEASTLGGGDINRPCCDVIVTGESEAWISFNVIQTIKEALSGPQDTFYGFVIKEELGENEMPYHHEGATFFSSEHTVDSLRPKLTVTYTTTAISFIHQMFGNRAVTFQKNFDYVLIRSARFTQYTVTIFNIQGKSLYSCIGSKDSPAEIPANTLSHGTYILQLAGKHGGSKDQISVKMVW